MRQPLPCKYRGEVRCGKKNGQKHRVAHPLHHKRQRRGRAVHAHACAYCNALRKIYSAKPSFFFFCQVGKTQRKHDYCANVLHVVFQQRAQQITRPTCRKAHPVGNNGHGQWQRKVFAFVQRNGKPRHKTIYRNGNCRQKYKR